MSEALTLISKPLTKKERMILNFKRNWPLLIFLLPAFVYVFIFSYVPLYGILIAFQDFIPGDQILGEYTIWVGWANFERFFSLPNFQDILLNTFLLSFFGFVVGFPLPIIVALMLNSLRGQKMKKIIQTIFYAPHFISLVVLVGMLYLFFGTNGLMNSFAKNLGLESYSYFLESDAFRPLFIFSGNWQDFGWSAIIYLAALSGVDPALHEAAKVDGASRFKRIFSVDIPAILPTISIILILSIGNLMSCGYEKVLLMQTDGNIDVSEIISTFVYKWGITEGDYSLTTAAGIFNSVINVILLIFANTAAKRVSGHSMW